MSLWPLTSELSTPNHSVRVKYSFWNCQVFVNVQKGQEVKSGLFIYTHYNLAVPMFSL